MSAARTRDTPEPTGNRRRANREAMTVSCAQETPDQPRRRREADNQATRTARSQETPDRSRRRRESVNDATEVRRRIAPAAPSAASAAAYVNFGNMDVECKNGHALRFVAERKVGSSETNPIFSNCCQGEKLIVQHITLLPDPPSLLSELLTGSTPREKGFRNNTVKYNYALCMASVHGELDEER